MVSNSTNNKENEQSPFTLTDLTQKGGPRYMTLKIQTLASDRHTHLAELNWLM
jgi:hypothetical protein